MQRHKVVCLFYRPRYGFPVNRKSVANSGISFGAPVPSRIATRVLFGKIHSLSVNIRSRLAPLLCRHFQTRRHVPSLDFTCRICVHIACIPTTVFIKIGELAVCLRIVPQNISLTIVLCISRRIIVCPRNRRRRNIKAIQSVLHVVHSLLQFGRSLNAKF